MTNITADSTPSLTPGGVRLPKAVAELLPTLEFGFTYELLDRITRTPFDTGFRYDPWLSFPARAELRDALREGVAPVLDRFTASPEAAGYVRDNIYDPARGGWQVVCPMRGDAVIMDFGCGLGAVSRSLARNCATVVGVDACYERLMVHSAINRELGFDNIELVCGDHRILEAVRSSSLDGVALNGVLEWVPEMLAGRPTAAQKRFLRQCRRILKPDGWLYVGIENRWGFPYFLGRNEEHIDLKLASLLPRWLATLYASAVRGKPYRTYTYGPQGYRHLMRAAGFEEPALYGVLPDYRSFAELRPLDRAERVRGAASRLGISKPWKQEIVETPAFFKRFVPSVGVVAPASSATGAAPWLADLAPSRIGKAYVKHDQASIWYQDANGRDWIRDVSLDEAAKAKLTRVSEVASCFSRTGLAGSWADWRLHRGDRAVWLDRVLVPGLPLSVSPDRAEQAVLDRVCDALVNIQSRVCDLDWPVHGVAGMCREYLGGAGHPANAHWWEELEAAANVLEQRCCGQRRLMHGDCTPANIILGNQVVFIDWEWSRVVDFPGGDVLKLMWGHDENPKSATRFWDHVILEQRLADSHARNRFERVHPAQDWGNAVLAYWCLRTARQLRAVAERGWTPAWAREQIQPSMDAVSQILHA